MRQVSELHEGSLRCFEPPNILRDIEQSFKQKVVRQKNVFFCQHIISHPVLLILLGIIWGVFLYTRCLFIQFSINVSGRLPEHVIYRRKITSTL